MIVGLGYNYHVGKDTAAQALCRELGYRQIAFADKLKELAFELNPVVVTSTRSVNVDAGRGRLKWSVQGLGGWDEAKRQIPEIRAFLQNLGLGARKVFGDDFWVNQALAGIPPSAKVVVSDVRFLNEAAAIKDLDGILINIVRSGYQGDNHRSENELRDFEGWDYVISNDGTIPELEQAVVRRVRDTLAKREAQAL